MLTAAATLSLTGPFALQGRHAARGLELWASTDRVDLQIVDDAGSAAYASDVYRRWLEDRVDLLLSPYGSGLVREVAPIVWTQGALLWNHGGSADDLCRHGVVPVAALASTYFRGAVKLADRRGLRRVVFAHGKGRFASAVVAGGRRQAEELGLATRNIDIGEWPTVGPLTDTAILIVGSFGEDIAAVRQIRASQEPGLLGCVAAGLLEFENRLGSTAGDVVGPVQWISRPSTPEVGPDGDEFSHDHKTRFGKLPDYVAAQAASAGFLAAEAHRRGYQHPEIALWKTTTMLGSFALDRSWRQVGHTPTTIRWQDHRQVQAI